MKSVLAKLGQNGNGTKKLNCFQQLPKFYDKFQNFYDFRADEQEDKYLDEPPEKKIVFIVHGLSVYGMLNVECLSKMRVLKKLMSYYGKHLDNFDIYLIPLANPDGFTYAQQVLEKD